MSDLRLIKTDLRRRGGGGLGSSRLDFISVKRGSITATSDDSQNAEDSIDGEEEPSVK